MPNNNNLSGIWQQTFLAHWSAGQSASGGTVDPSRIQRGLALGHSSVSGLIRWSSVLEPSLKEQQILSTCSFYGCMAEVHTRVGVNHKTSAETITNCFLLQRPKQVTWPNSTPWDWEIPMTCIPNERRKGGANDYEELMLQLEAVWVVGKFS